MYKITTAELPAYEYPPRWIPVDERVNHPDYSGKLEDFLPRLVKLRRAKTSDALGFNVRGGKEYFTGIFISKVMPNSDAERLSLKEGDQIMLVNGINYEDIEHSEAVKILKADTDINMQATRKRLASAASKSAIASLFPQSTYGQVSIYWV